MFQVKVAQKIKTYISFSVFFHENPALRNVNRKNMVQAVRSRIEIQGVPLATEPGISLIILPLMRILQRNLKRTTDTFLFISHTTKILLFKFRCNIFIGVIIIK